MMKLLRQDRNKPKIVAFLKIFTDQIDKHIVVLKTTKTINRFQNLIHYDGDLEDIATQDWLLDIGKAFGLYSDFSTVEKTKTFINKLRSEYLKRIINDTLFSIVNYYQGSLGVTFITQYLNYLLFDLSNDLTFPSREAVEIGRGVNIIIQKSTRLYFYKKGSTEPILMAESLMSNDLFQSKYLNL